MTTCRDEELDAQCREYYSHDWGITFPWYRTYNEAMKQWLSCIREPRPEVENRDIPVVYATPERAFASLISPRVEGQPDIPIISFVMTGVSWDADRFSNIFTPWDRTLVDGKWRLQSKPMPWNLSYNVSVWTKFAVTLDYVGYTLLSRFTPKSYIKPFGFPVSEVSFTGHSDTSALEPGQDDRLLRHDYQFEIKAWMPMPYREVGQIGNVFIAIDSDEDAEPVYAGGTDTVTVSEGQFTVDADTGGNFATPIGVTTREVDESETDQQSQVPKVIVREP